jgi:hypothetical protein
VYLDPQPARNNICTATLIKLSSFVPGVQKLAPCFALYGFVPRLYIDETFLLTAFILSAKPTNFIAGPLGVIASFLPIIGTIKINHCQKETSRL